MSQFSPNFQKFLEYAAVRKIDVKINDNRSTMLSVKWMPKPKISLHRMFLKAPENILEDLTHYLKGNKKQLSPLIKAYIEKNLHDLDYSHELNPSKLYTQGKVYDLKKIYTDLNTEYFNQKLNLHITWFGKLKSQYSRLIFGYYYDPLKLIKIHKLLDNSQFPDYFVAYVVYHEMLHFVCPSYVNEKGTTHIHNKDFKEREREFKYFKQAQKWMKEHQAQLFNPHFLSKLISSNS